MFEESTSLLVAAGPESTSRLRSTTQLRRGARPIRLCTVHQHSRSNRAMMKRASEKPRTDEKELELIIGDKKYECKN